MRASDQPDVFANFFDLQAMFDIFGEPWDSEQHDQEGPIGPDDEIIVYDGDTLTLISSAEFQRLSVEMKALVFKDIDMTRAFANFVKQNGSFIIDNSVNKAVFSGVHPPTITLPQVFLAPSSNYYLADSFFKLAHEIYHH